jgi:CBS domain-containing protein
MDAIPIPYSEYTLAGKSRCHTSREGDRPISSMMETDILVVHDEDTVARVEQILSTHRFSSVPVLGAKDAVVGMICAQDIVAFHSARRMPAAVRAWEICRITHFQVGPDDSVIDVARLMLDNHIEHIAVTDKGNLLGLVSAIDFVEQLVIKAAR